VVKGEGGFGNETVDLEFDDEVIEISAIHAAIKKAARRGNSETGSVVWICHAAEHSYRGFRPTFLLTRTLFIIVY
jgi:hypothetical protein